jgi:hypothetical protein
MPATQPASEWFGIEKRAKEHARKREEKRREKQKAKEQKVEYVEGEPITEDEAWFRHHNWQDKRTRVRQALLAACSSQNALNAFDNCGSDCTVEFNEAEKRYRVRGCYCHSRHCEPCMRSKSTVIVNNLRQELKSREHRTFRFITLTLRHDHRTPLKEQRQRLYDCYKKLRGTPLWKSQNGGVATLEIIWVEAGDYPRKNGGGTYHTDGGWHPHLHIISEGSFLDTYKLSDQWHAITGDSYMVDVRIMSKEKDVAYYVGKYVTKGTTDTVWADPARAKEWVLAVKGVRMAMTFGNWRGMKLLAKPKVETEGWQTLGTLGSIVRRAQAGDTWALDLLVHLTTQVAYDPHRKRRPKRE